MFGAVGEYAPVNDPRDWRSALLVGATPLEVPAAARNPVAWPGCAPRRAVSAWVLARGAVAAA